MKKTGLPYKTKYRANTRAGAVGAQGRPFATARAVSKYLLVALTVCIALNCKKPFVPAALTSGNNYLVVDGIINTSPNGVTSINLSRARNIGDTTYAVLHENNATVVIESSSGLYYPLHQVQDSAYVSDTLNLDANQTYRLNITTQNREQYLSDFVKPKQSPAIDSVSWQQGNGVNIYVSTHDPANSTRYYRWDFTETWEHNAPYEISWGDSNNIIFSVTSVTYATYTYHCWTDSNSTSILLGTSAALSQDVINQAPITYIPENGTKIGIEYSILVRQYALTPDAYQYWGIIQKNTQSIGTLFDPQPSQLHGNIVSVSNPNEPVIGFVSAGTVEDKRIFINRLDLANWQAPLSELYCPVKTIPTDPNNFLHYTYPDTAWAPYYFGAISLLNITKKECLDCRYQGGTNLKPAYWR